jgi:hypothetical protein
MSHICLSNKVLYLVSGVLLQFFFKFDSFEDFLCEDSSIILVSLVGGHSYLAASVTAYIRCHYEYETQHR